MTKLDTVRIAISTALWKVKLTVINALDGSGWHSTRLLGYILSMCKLPEPVMSQKEFDEWWSASRLWLIEVGFIDPDADWIYTIEV